MTRERPPVLTQGEAEAYRKLKAEAELKEARRRIEIRRALEDKIAEEGQ